MRGAALRLLCSFWIEREGNIGQIYRMLLVENSVLLEPGWMA